MVAKIGVETSENEPRKGSEKWVVYRNPVVEGSIGMLVGSYITGQGPLEVDSPLHHWI